MSSPVAIPYDQRQVGDMAYVFTRFRIAIPAGWIDISFNQDTNPHIEAWHIVTADDPDIYEAWNVDRQTASVIVFRRPGVVGDRP